MKIFTLIGLLILCASAHAEIHCDYEYGSTQLMSDTGEKAEGDTEKPATADCLKGAAGLCAAQLTCTDDAVAGSSVNISTFCPSVNGKCPQDAKTCVNGSLLNISAYVAKLKTPPPPKVQDKPSDAGGAGAR